MCANGVVVNTYTRTGGLPAMRLQGVVSNERSPEDWHEHEFPNVEQHTLLASLHTDDFWLALYVSEPASRTSQ